ncbi:MAG TPA: alpha-galactosidase [Candidatus Sulfotelmatobacter sp.]|nr:alpha-galactosidase [Candidatus Sulfotelmatobacter sp.]
MRSALFCLVVFVCWRSPTALDNGLAQTPPMGWNSWATYELKIDEGLIRATADAMVSHAMKAAGYQYVIVDAGWKAKNRDAEGRLRADPDKFPSGIKALADYVHNKGLKFGLYTDAGTEDCVSGAPGSRGFEEKDASSFAEWGVDYMKEDWCHTEGMSAQEAYTKMSRAIQATGRPMVFSLCEWGDNEPWTWAAPMANLWRTTGDSKDCWDCGRETMNKPGGYPRGWVLILDAQQLLAPFAGPGHWNDPDLLQVGERGLTVEESRAQFSLWAILAAPLIATNDLRSMASEIRDILLNHEVIAVDQDSAGIQGKRVRVEGHTEAWMRLLSDGSRAVVLFNRGKSSATVRVRWTDIGQQISDALPVRDLWKHENMGNSKAGYSATVPAHGVVMIRVGSPAKQKN